MRGLLLALAFLCPLMLGCRDSVAKANEETLRQQMEEEWAAFQEEDWASLYEMRTAEQRASCSLEEFTSRMSILPVVFGDTHKDAEFEISNVIIEGTRATFTVVLRKEGRVLSEPNTTEEVIWEEGRWREAAVDPCERGEIRKDS